MHLLLRPRFKAFCGSISIFFIELSTKTYLTGVCYDLNDTVGELRVREMGFMFCGLHVSLK